MGLLRVFTLINVAYTLFSVGKNIKFFKIKFQFRFI